MIKGQCQSCGSEFESKKRRKYCRPECRPSHPGGSYQAPGMVYDSFVVCHLIRKGYQVYRAESSNYECSIVAMKRKRTPLRILVRSGASSVRIFASDAARCDIVALVYGWDAVKFFQSKGGDTIEL